MRKTSLVFVLALSAAANAQMLTDRLNFFGSEKGGFGIYGVSAFGGYSHSNVPISSLGLDRSNAAYGVSGSVGWQTRGENTNASVLYTGSYNGLNLDSDLNSYSQTLSLGTSFKLAPKWTLSISGSGQDSNLSQYLFQPLGFSVLSALPTSFNDLSAALGVGQFSSAQVAAINTSAGTAYLISPIRTALLGDRVLSYSGSVGLNYALSRRWNFHVNGFSSGGQTRYAADSNTPGQNYLMPLSIGGDAGFSFAFYQTPRTDMGISVDEYVNHNRYQEGYSTTASLYAGRKMGRNWVMRVYAGGTRSTYTAQFAGRPATLQAVGGGSLAYKLRSQTFIGSYDISGNDTYGFANGTNVSANGGWNWRRPGSRLSLFANYSRHQTRNTGYLGILGWQAAAGTSVTLTRQIYLTGQYVYMDTFSDYLGSTNTYKAQSVRMSLGWSPRTLNR